MKMRVDELQKRIMKAIKSNLSHKDLCSLCAFNDIPTSGLKRNIQDRLETFISNQSYNQLVLISNKIDEYNTASANSKRTSATTTVPQIVPQAAQHPYRPTYLSDALLSQAPINLEEELGRIDRGAVSIPNITSHSNGTTIVPTQASSAHNIRLPNTLPHIPVQISPFFCCPVCLQPLSLLIPQTMPNISQNNRVTSHFNINFTLSDDAHKLISRNCQNVGNKVDYKWQVLLRFVAIDPSEPQPTQGKSISEVMPPYLAVTVNTESTPLWDILPSNCRTKEGKRHPKPINITDKLNNNRSSSGYKQSVVIDWWQTPVVFQYYYVGVYLERKLSVRELLDLFVSNRHVNIRPYENTLMLIKSKLNEYRNNDDDDDLVVSSVLPICLSCPVGKSRIEIPIRGLHCQHVQCFDAQLYLSMNERRSIWKCPVCDISATPNELFCDKYFQKILADFKDNEDANEININADGTYVPVFKRNKDERTETKSHAVTETKSTIKIDTMIVLDSDDEEEQPKNTPTRKDKVPSPQKVTQPSKGTNPVPQTDKERTPKSSSSKDKSKHSQKNSQSNTHKPKSVQIQISGTTSRNSNDKTSETGNSVQTNARPKSVVISVSRCSIEPVTSNVPVTSPMISSCVQSYPLSSTLTSVPFLPPYASSTFSSPPPTFPVRPMPPAKHAPIPPIHTPRSVVSNRTPESTVIISQLSSQTTKTTTNNTVQAQIAAVIQSTVPSIVPVPIVSTAQEPMDALKQLQKLLPTLQQNEKRNDEHASTRKSMWDAIDQPHQASASMWDILSTRAPQSDNAVTKDIVPTVIPAPVKFTMPNTLSVTCTPNPIHEPSKNINSTTKTVPEPCLTSVATYKSVSNAINEIVPSIYESVQRATVANTSTPAIKPISTPTSILKSISSHASNPVLTPSLSSVSTPITTHRTPSTATSVAPFFKSNVDVIRTIHDVVKTLPTHLVAPLELPIKTKIITSPIICPVVIVERETHAFSSSPGRPPEAGPQLHNVISHLQEAVSQRKEVATLSKQIVPQHEQVVTDTETKEPDSTHCKTATHPKEPISQPHEMFIPPSVGSQPPKDITVVPTTVVSNCTEILSQLSEVLTQSSDIQRSLSLHPSVNKPVAESPESPPPSAHQTIVAVPTKAVEKISDTPTKVAVVPIPVVSIDLTSDDDEEPAPAPGPAPAIAAPVTAAAPVAGATKPMNGKVMRWCNVNDPSFRNNFYNRSAAANNGRGQPLPRSATNNSLSHFKTHRPDFMKRTVAVHRPIDLTGEEGDEEVPAKKKRKDEDIANGTFEEGQLGDTDSDSSSDGVGHRSVQKVGTRVPY